MDALGHIARRLPLVARRRPACTPLPQRVHELCAQARTAAETTDTVAASAVFNLSALLASDCGLPHLARQWCHRHTNAYLRAHPLGAQDAVLSLEPLVNLARLHIRSGEGERAAHLIESLYTAVSARIDTTIDGITVPAASLTTSAEAHTEVRRWLWATMLATSARAFAVAGRWGDARTCLRTHKGVGRRMLDGRQITVMAHVVAGDLDGALTLLHETIPGEPLENTVTACLALACDARNGNKDRGDTLLTHYHSLDGADPRFAVVHTRLGLSVIDALGGAERPRARQVAADLIHQVTASQDGYAVRDLMAHSGCSLLLTTAQTRNMAGVLDACALKGGDLPAALHADLLTALELSEDVITRTIRSRVTADAQR